MFGVFIKDLCYFFLEGVLWYFFLLFVILRRIWSLFGLMFKYGDRILGMFFLM